MRLISIPGRDECYDLDPKGIEGFRSYRAECSCRAAALWTVRGKGFDAFPEDVCANCLEWACDAMWRLVEPEDERFADVIVTRIRYALPTPVPALAAA